MIFDLFFYVKKKKEKKKELIHIHLAIYEIYTYLSDFCILRKKSLFGILPLSGNPVPQFVSFGCLFLEVIWP